MNYYIRHREEEGEHDERATDRMTMRRQFGTGTQARIKMEFLARCDRDMVSRRRLRLIM